MSSQNLEENNETSSLATSTTSPPQTNTLTVLDAPMNGKVYLVGTAHFSVESQKEVIELIRNVKPNRVVLELCSSRVNILKLDEETVLREAKEMDMSKIMKLIREVLLENKNRFLRESLFYNIIDLSHQWCMVYYSHYLFVYTLRSLRSSV